MPSLTPRLPFPTTVDAISQRLMALGPQVRMWDLCRCVTDAPPHVFWPVVLEWYDRCDDSVYIATHFLELMKKNGSWARAREFSSLADVAFYDSLPPSVPVYRGGPKSSVRSLSWTTDPAVARQFAQGHRCMLVTNPVIASAAVPKDAIFFCTQERRESEIVLNWRRLERLAILPYQRQSQPRFRLSDS